MSAAALAMSPTQPDVATRPEEARRPDDQPLPKTARKGIGLCLSGGGFRASLFHLGALKRLNELGILNRPDFRTITSVSGGSITAAALATALAKRGKQPTGPIPNEEWNKEVRDPLRALTKKDQRTGPFLKRFLPWKIWKTETTVEALSARYENELTSLKLKDLPHQPDFLFLATDMAWGVSFGFARDWMGDYQAGYMPPP
jgi:NTE family protein